MKFKNENKNKIKREIGGGETNERKICGRMKRKREALINGRNNSAAYIFAPFVYAFIVAVFICLRPKINGALIGAKILTAIILIAGKSKRRQ